MALPFFNSGERKKRDQMLAIDLGGRTTKAVYLQRKGDQFVLAGCALSDAPIYEKHLSVELLSGHLKAVCQLMDAKTKLLTLAIGVNESFVRHADMPPIPVADMRQVLKNNARIYLQQDLSGHIFDCYVTPPKAAPKPAEKFKPGAPGQKYKVLVAGAKKQLVDDLQTAVRNTGLTADCVMPGLLGPVNAFEMAHPEVFSRDVVALVDIGFKNTSICLLQQGELALSRVVGIGGDRFTHGLAESLNVSYAEAEGIKVGMAGEVRAALEALIVPLGRELRASIDFFEHQQDKPVSKVYITGGSSRSEFIVQTLQNELLADCVTWMPTTFLQLALPPQQTAEIEYIAPQLTVAIGAAMAAF